MELIVIAVGNKMPEWVVAAFNEYQKRMPRETPVKLIEIKPEKRSSSNNTQVLELEKNRILAQLPAQAEIIALDETGETWSSIKLSHKLSDWLQQGKPIVFVIGGADGLHAEIKTKANGLLALSGFTLPHGLVRVILAEQLYRASSILQHHPYHRA